MIPRIAFILAAGLGTRMGENSQKIPKPLWPIFNLSLLEILINQLHGLGIKEIYVNTYHLSDLMQSYCQKKDLKVKLLIEEELLGSGGCFFNLKKTIGEQKVLAVNGDSFFAIDRNVFEQECEQAEGHLLFARKVAFDKKYNGFLYQDKKLMSIAKPPFQEDYWTFAGFSLVDLSLIGNEVKACSFFDEVVVPGQESSQISFANADFYDFGELEYYCHNIYNSSQNIKLQSFLTSHGVDFSLAGESFNWFIHNKKIHVSFQFLEQSIEVEVDLNDEFLLR